MSKKDALLIFKAAVAAVHPSRLLQDHLSVTENSFVFGGQSFPKSSIQHIYVIGAGKASAAMAVETEKILNDYITDGIVITKYGHSLETKNIKILEAAHPVPDENCVEAVNLTSKLLEKVKKDDIVICLISGGASALWCDLPDGLNLAEVQTSFNALINSGAAIDEINTVRKHLSNIKGGQLIRHCNGASVFSFMISDVPHDDIEVIASGPTVPDKSTYKDAYTILEKFHLTALLPENILLHLNNGIEARIAETPKPGDSLFSRTVNKIIGTNKIAIAAASEKAKNLGYEVLLIDDFIQGNTEAEAIKFVDLALNQTRKPVCIIQGGETTLKISGKGKGGRNQHFSLAALKELQTSGELNAGRITILSGGTDGTDGPTDAAGGIVDHETLNKALQKNLSIENFLVNHDSYHFLEQTDSLVITGPTQTNVMDIMIAILS